MHTPGRRASRLIAAAALFTFGLFLGGTPAGATTLSYDVGDQAFVHVVGRQANITVHTWDRNVVQVEWPDGEPFAVFKGVQSWSGAPVAIPARLVKERLPGGTLGDAVLPPEEFPITGIAIGLHDSIRIDEAPEPPPSDMVRPANEPAHLVITVPQTAKIVDVRDGRGDVALADYRGNTFVSTGGAHVTLTNLGGDAFVQTLFGHLYVLDSNFDHLRARSNGADLVFERCRIKQIEANTLTGQIVYDNGSFTPGLARFESDRGNVALGVNGAAQLEAHTQDGRIFSALAARNGAAANASDVSASIGAGGPVISASSAHGNVYMYEGSISDRRGLASEWRAVNGTLQAKRRLHPGTAAARPAAQPPEPTRPPKTDRRPHMRRRSVTAKTSAASRRRV